jgi:hypothetical protein
MPPAFSLLRRSSSLLLRFLSSKTLNPKSSNHFSPLIVRTSTIRSLYGGSGERRWYCSRSSVTEVEEPTTSDGLTVEGIVGKRWTILDEGESDWRSHAAAIAQSIKLIKNRLQVDFWTECKCAYLISDFDYCSRS